MKHFIFVLTLSLAGAASALSPIVFDDPTASGPVATSQHFAADMGARYAAGADLATTLADAKANGFACETLARPAGALAAPSHECVRATHEGDCTREWAIDLNAPEGKLRTPAAGSFALLCVGAVLPAKRSKAYQK